MEFGLSIPHTGKLASPDYVRDFCQAADELGYEGLWTVDHPAIPPHSDSEYTLGAKPRTMPDGSVSDLLAPNYEMTSTMLYVAGITRRAKIGSSVAVLPLRNPVLNARMLATLDVYSGGRLVHGVGVGWLREEALAMQMPWEQRGARTEEHIALLRRLWTAAPMQPERLAGLLHTPGGYLVAENRDPAAFPIYANAGIAITAKAGVSAWKFTAPNGAVSMRDASVLVQRLREFERIGVHHLRIDPVAPDPAGRLEILQQLAKEILPALR